MFLQRALVVILFAVIFSSIGVQTYSSYASFEKQKRKPMPRFLTVHHYPDIPNEQNIGHNFMRQFKREAKDKAEIRTFEEAQEQSITWKEFEDSYGEWMVAMYPARTGAPYLCFNLYYKVPLPQNKYVWRLMLFGMFLTDEGDPLRIFIRHQHLILQLPKSRIRYGKGEIPPANPVKIPFHQELGYIAQWKKQFSETGKK